MNLPTIRNEVQFHGNNEPAQNFKIIGSAKRKQRVSKANDENTIAAINIEESNNSVYNILNQLSLNPELAESTELQQALLTMIANNSFDSSPSSSPSLKNDNNSNDDVIMEDYKEEQNNDEIGVEEEEDEWQEAFKKLDQDSSKLDKKDLERRRQMAKNREYARKCVQKKKDQRRQAEVRSAHILKRIILEQKMTMNKEKNANFAVYLRSKNQEKGLEEKRKQYEKAKIEMNKKFDDMFAQDETVNLNYHRLASSREEFEKAARDLHEKNGVIGTLGSRKIRAKQQMEWRQHLYTISVNEHKLRREVQLSQLADTYVRDTVPGAAPLVQSIPKHLLDELIKTDRTSDLEEFFRFVAENTHIFDSECSIDESVIK